MNSMFYNAVKFDQDISAWETSSVKDMSFMFYGAKSFNKPIGSWNVSGVTDLNTMFYNAVKFDQDISAWETSAVKKNMSFMFYGAKSFDSPIGSWNVSGVKSMHAMFAGATSFNQDLGLWDTSAVSEMSYVFAGAKKFSKPLSTWNFSAALNRTHSFDGSGVTGCLKSRTFQALGLRDFTFQDFDFDIELCPSCPCRDPNLACVDQKCCPINSGFIDLGRDNWILEGAFATAEGFRNCVEKCQASEECSSFLLFDSGAPPRNLSAMPCRSLCQGWLRDVPILRSWTGADMPKPGPGSSEHSCDRCQLVAAAHPSERGPHGCGDLLVRVVSRRHRASPRNLTTVPCRTLCHGWL